jgi:outer membrane biosynthesis protein TonB
MVLTQAEENKNRLISAGITALLFGLLLLFLILFNMITPNPPFPLQEGGGGGKEMALGMISNNNDAVDYNTLGNVTDVVTEKNEKIVTDKNGEEVPLEEDRPEVKEEKTVIKPTKPKEEVKPMSPAEKIRADLKKTKNKKSEDDTKVDDDILKPGGNPNGKVGGDKNGDGGKGGGTGGGNGPDKGDGDESGSGGGRGGGISVSLGGRSVVQPPKLPSDTKEEGKVVVDIVVDTEGKVIEASPNGRGTTTSSALLKAKAKKAAMETKFNVDGKFEEQRGTITIIFSFD